MPFRSIKISLSSRVYPAATYDYSELERIGDKAKPYVICSYTGRKVKKLAKVRKSLMELSINTIKTSRVNKRIRPRQTPRGLFDCKLYEIAIYNYITY